MFCRASGLAFSTLLVGSILVAGTSGASVARAVEADPQSLRFDEVEPFLRAHSPRARMIEQQALAAESALQTGTTWSNPTLRYGQEENDLFREWEVLLSKRFVAPFRQSDARTGRERGIEAARLGAEADLMQLVAEMKAAYVALQLREQYLDRLGRLSEFIRIAASIAETRHAEGDLSGVDRDLFRLAEYAIDASRRQARQDYEIASASWQADMGLPTRTPITLESTVRFIPVDLRDPGFYVALIADHPVMQARVARVDALAGQSRAAHPWLVPAIQLEAGYKSFDKSVDGFVVGVGLDLPLFDRGAGPARQLEAESTIAEHERVLGIARAEAEVTALVSRISETMDALEAITGQTNRSDELANTLLYSYREGTITLDSLLSAIQIEVAALDSYFDEMAAYYLCLFRLEAMTGASIVQPVSGD